MSGGFYLCSICGRDYGGACADPDAGKQRAACPFRVCAGEWKGETRCRE